jgi:hypothetical protein
MRWSKQDRISRLLLRPLSLVILTRGQREVEKKMFDAALVNPNGPHITRITLACNLRRADFRRVPCHQDHQAE